MQESKIDKQRQVQISVKYFVTTLCKRSDNLVFQNISTATRWGCFKRIKYIVQFSESGSDNLTTDIS